MMNWLKANPHALVDRHFGGGVRARDARKMWRHLEVCEPCRMRYRAHALLEAVDDDADARARQRLAPAALHRQRGAPTEPASRSRIWSGVFILAAGAAMAGALLLVLRPEPRAADEFAMRGGSDSVPSLAIYRVQSAQDDAGVATARARASGHVLPGEGLAFSYVVPSESDYSRLMIFAVDAAGAVFWFWPAWQDGRQDPEGLSVARGGVVELGEAVFHDYAPGPLHVYGLFSQQPYSVKAVEAVLGEVGVLGLHGPSNHVWSQTLEVQP